MSVESVSNAMAKSKTINAKDHNKLLKRIEFLENELASLRHSENDIAEIGRELYPEKSTNNLKRLFDSIDEFLFILDECGNTLYVNDTVVRRLDYSLDELANKSILMVHPPELHEEAAKIIQQILSGQAVTCPIPLRTKSGQYIPVETQVLRGEWRGRPALIGISKELPNLSDSDRKRMEYALKVAEEKFLLAFNYAPGAFTITTIDDGRFTDVNDGFLVMSQYAREEVVGRTELELSLWPSYDHYHFFRHTLQKLGTIRNLEFSFRRKSGEIGHGLISASLIQIGGTDYVLSAMSDITHKKVAEKSLEETNAKLNATLNALPDLMFQLDDTATILDVRAPDAQALFRPPSAFIGKRVQDVLPAEPAGLILHAIQDALMKGVHFGTEYSLDLENGLHWFELSVSKLVTGDRSISLIALVRDITVRKNTEEALRKSLEDKEVLLREIHHRVKNNLASIIGLIKLQKKSKGPKNDQALEDLTARITSMSLVHDTLYRSDNFTEIDFGRYLEDLISGLLNSYSPKSIKTTVAAKNVKMSIDYAMLCGLMINELITNAIKYAFPEVQSDRKRRRNEIRIFAEQNGSEYRISLEDNGTGLPESFDWRSSSGLGLRLVRILGEHQLNGTISFESNGWTRFNFVFKTHPAGH